MSNSYEDKAAALSCAHTAGFGRLNGEHLGDCMLDGNQFTTLGGFEVVKVARCQAAQPFPIVAWIRHSSGGIFSGNYDDDGWSPSGGSCYLLVKAPEVKRMYLVFSRIERGSMRVWPAQFGLSEQIPIIPTACVAAVEDKANADLLAKYAGTEVIEVRVPATQLWKSEGSGKDGGVPLIFQFLSEHFLIEGLEKK